MGIVRRIQYVVYRDGGFEGCSIGEGLASANDTREGLIAEMGNDGLDGAWLNVGRKWYCPDCVERIMGDDL
jgi:hypothetical protein